VVLFRFREIATQPIPVGGAALSPLLIAGAFAKAARLCLRFVNASRSGLPTVWRPADCVVAPTATNVINKIKRNKTKN